MVSMTEKVFQGGTMAQKETPITVAYGDGIGPEITEAVLHILRQAGARIKIETTEVGKALYEKGYTTGIGPSTWESLERTHVILKGPITTPQGGGVKSLNVTLRKKLGLYANVRPCVAYAPFVKTNHPDLNVVIVRENEEDLYAGIEHRQTHNTYQTLKLVTRSGSERIIRYAFEYALKNNRKRVSCFSKDNIMKMTDGIFHKVFDEIGKKYYPMIEQDHHIIDIGAARLANAPEQFDVIVTSNLYGDIISDIVAETSGSVGLAGSANIGDEYAMFEAIHGSAPDIAGKNIANPSGMLHGAIMMLVHIGQPDIAEKIHNAWLKTLEDGVHTGDIYDMNMSAHHVGTKEFADAVVERLGQKPTTMIAVSYEEMSDDNLPQLPPLSLDKSEKKQLVGVDVFIDASDITPNDLAEKIKEAAHGELQLQVISCKGLAVWPDTSGSKNFMNDHWQARFVPSNQEKVTSHQAIIELFGELNEVGIDFIKAENLYSFDDKIGFSLGQGQ